MKMATTRDVVWIVAPKTFAEFADPDDLVDQAADPGEEEENEEHPGRIPDRDQGLGTGG